MRPSERRDVSEKLVGNDFAAPTQFGEMETHFNIESEDIARERPRDAFDDPFSD
jgi:hypothetical protein